MINRNIKLINESLDSFKADLGVKQIRIAKLIKESKMQFGISETGHLFVTNITPNKIQSKSHIIIQSGKTKKGEEFYILNDTNEKLQFKDLGIPVLADKKVFMHVHHKFYVYVYLPWEYDDESLVTLCNICHWDLHKTTNVPIYTNKSGKLESLNYTPCTRCNGSGVFPEYKNINGGLCFRCHGNKYEELIKKTTLRSSN